MIEDKQKQLNITRPIPPKPAGSYIPVVISGNLAFVSGQIPMQEGKVLYTGKVPSERSIEEAQSAAKMCAINLLAQLKSNLGSLDKITKIIRVSGFVNCTPVREIREDDADNFLSLCRQLDEESRFMLLEPGERTIPVEEQAQCIRNKLSAHNQAIFVAEEEGTLVGHLSAYGGRFARNRHVAYIMVGILEGFTSRGIGTALFERLERWAREHGFHRMELTVMVHNQRGVGLYQKMGFAIEGIKKDSLLVDGSYVDEYYMAKLIEQCREE